MSFGVPVRPRGTAFITYSRCWGVMAAVMSVSMYPGAMTLAVMFREAYSRAIERAAPSSAALVAAYAVCPALPMSATTLDMNTIRPHLERIMPRLAARAHARAPRTFV